MSETRGCDRNEWGGRAGEEGGTLRETELRREKDCGCEDGFGFEDDVGLKRRRLYAIMKNSLLNEDVTIWERDGRGVGNFWGLKRLLLQRRKEPASVPIRKERSKNLGTCHQYWIYLIE